jgi:predicted nucleic acid-binding protein
VITETVFGFRMLPRARQNAREWDSLRPALELIDMDEDDALNAASLQVMLRRQGRQLSTVDALIATVALRYDLVLLTTDQDFDPVPSLIVENWMSR